MVSQIVYRGGGERRGEREERITGEFAELTPLLSTQYFINKSGGGRLHTTSPFTRPLWTTPYPHHVFSAGVFGWWGRGRGAVVRCHIHILTGVRVQRALSFAHVSVHVWWWLLQSILRGLYRGLLRGKLLDVKGGISVVHVTCVSHSWVIWVIWTWVYISVTPLITNIFFLILPSGYCIFPGKSVRRI